ncbi:DUF2163 domain-containing protein [Albimonas pacifica]|uniref:Bacteriophage phiJL001 Gp84 C-terminal domain-containing protein n=1 Tax=Albimonas pacifica TaxID=1114924 RepID=A0A1I3GLT4_9RHOB|nr:DUF2163 domain-containing protein [Albimonas pacifica]SFI24447.1 phage conserved hypothetical protein BR0599 [Albimonas pacifica]
MRELDRDLELALEGETTTLCRCWVVKRRDGVELGFTDHDQPLSFGGVEFEPETGFEGTQVESSLGLAVDNQETMGALRSDAIREKDILLGLYDGAEVTRWVVDFTDVGSREKLSVGVVGEIRRGDLAFELEILGRSEVLNRPLGRVFQRSCDAEVGDARCGVELDGAFRRSGEVLAVQDARRFAVAGNAAESPAGWFDYGKVEWTSGANDGQVVSVRRFYLQAGQMVVDLWNTPASPIQAGDGFRLVAGCDKTASTCKAKFANFLNFRGFPLMPGEDWSTAYPRSDELHDGGSLFHD